MSLITVSPDRPETECQISVLGDGNPIVHDLHRVGAIDLIVASHPQIRSDWFCKDTVDPINIYGLAVNSARLVRLVKIHQRSHLLLPEGRRGHIDRQQGRAIIQLKKI